MVAVDACLDGIVKAENGNSVDDEFEAAADDNAIKDGFDSFGVGSLITVGWRIDCKFDDDRGPCDVSVGPDSSFCSAEMLCLFVG